MRHAWKVFAVLIAACVALVAGCGGNPPPLTGSDSDEPAPAEAQDAIVTGLETMFTWYPARDASPQDAYIRALPYLGQQLQAGKDNKLERGNSVWWQEWRTERAEVTAKALLVAGEHPEDTPDTVERAVLVTQTVKGPDGTELDTNIMRIDRVVAKKGPEKWRVEEISFFPVNEFRTAVCPPGQSHQPAPDGPCAPNPPPPPKQCPDGTTVPADQMCPAPNTGPSLKQCPDGTSVPANADCSKTGPITTGPSGPPPVTCPTGQTADADGTCQCPSGTVKDGDRCDQPCPEGQTRGPDGTCECPSGTVKDGDKCVEPCPQGQERDSNGTCGCPTGTELYNGTCVAPCQEGQVRGSDGTCSCPTGTELYNGTCVAPCPQGQTRGRDGSCYCPAGTELYNGSCVSPCPQGQVRGSSGTCSCPAGTELYNGSCVAPCVGRAYRDSSGSCVCPNGSTGTPAEGCGSYVGMGPPPPSPRIEQVGRTVPASAPPGPDRPSHVMPRITATTWL